MPGDVEMACVPCAPQKPGERLQMAFEKRDLPGFKAALRDVSVDDDPHCATCLHNVVTDPVYVEFLRQLLRAGVDPNTLDKQGKGLLLKAADENLADVLQVLLEVKKTNVNVLDYSGNTALHLAVLGPGSPDVKARCVSLLLDCPDLDANKKNDNGPSAVFLAARKCPRVVVEAFLKHPHIDLDHVKSLDGKATARSMIETKYPELQGRLPAPVNSHPSLGDELMILLRSGNEQDTARFCDLVKEASPTVVNYIGGKDTLLQRASGDGNLKAVSVLLAHKADPNKTSGGPVSRPPLFRACVKGHETIVRALLDDERTDINVRTEEGDTALITLVRYWNTWKGDYKECLNHLLEYDIDINACNERGETALHYASITEDRQLVLDLLKVGAYIGGANKSKRLPLSNIPRDVLETHLNECITYHESHFSEKYRIGFDYSCLVPPSKTTPRKSTKLLNSKTKDCENGDCEEASESYIGSCPETDPLLYMTRKPDLRPLLKHPVLTSFLELKWQKLALLFMINISFYFLFVLMITGHIVWGNGRSETAGVQTSSEADEVAAQGDSTCRETMCKPGFECLQWVPVCKPGFECLQWAPMNASKCDANDTSAKPALSETRQTINNVVEGLSIFLLVVLMLRELFQFLVSPKRYISWSNRENYLELMIIVFASVVLFQNQLQPYFSAITILFSWAELVLLVGRHPMLSTYIEMLKTVSWNFLKFLAWYSMLIIAFALSFYTLFRDNDEAGNFFVDPGLSIFKTVVMLTGEFDANDIPFVEFPIVSHAVFVMFVFLIAIVLFNLLNGLAVSDTQAIKNDAELVGYVSRVKLVAYIERTVLGDTEQSSWRSPLKWPCLSCWRSPLKWPCLARRVTLFTDTENVAGHVLPNEGAALWVGPLDDKRDKAPRHAIKLDSDVIKAAEVVLEMKDRPTDMDQVKNSLEAMDNRLEAMDNRLEAMEQLLQKLMAVLNKD